MAFLFERVRTARDNVATDAKSLDGSVDGVIVEAGFAVCDARYDKKIKVAIGCIAILGAASEQPNLLGAKCAHQSHYNLAQCIVFRCEGTAVGRPTSSGRCPGTFLGMSDFRLAHGYRSPAACGSRENGIKYEHQAAPGALCRSYSAGSTGPAGTRRGARCQAVTTMVAMIANMAATRATQAGQPANVQATPPAAAPTEPPK